MISPTILVSKNDIGRLVNLRMNSEIIDMLTFIPMCNKSQFRIKSIRFELTINTTCAIYMIMTKLMLLWATP